LTLAAQHRHAITVATVLMVLVVLTNSAAAQSAAQCASGAASLDAADADPLSRAKTLARAGQYAAAITILKRPLFDGAHAAPALVALGQTLAWAGHYTASVMAFDSAATFDRNSIEALSGAAHSLALAGNHDAALRRYAALLPRAPDNIDLRASYATALGWAGRYEESAAFFTELARGSGSPSRIGSRGLASLAAWRGELAQATERWTELIQSDPDDVESWNGLSRSLRWAGDSRGAAVAAQRARALAPCDRDASDALALARADMEMATEPAGLSVWDSDGNRSRFFSISARMSAPWRGSATVIASQRDADFLASRGTSRTIRSVMLWRPVPGGKLKIRGEGGASLLDGRRSPSDTQPVRLRPLAALGAVWHGSNATIGLAAAHRPFDETALLIVNGLTTTAVDATAEFRLTRHSTLSVDGGLTRYDGGTPNTRRALASSLRANVTSWLVFGVAARHHANSGTPRDGYFAPRRYGLAEALVSLGRRKDSGVSTTLEGALGTQRIDASAGSHTTQGTQRLAALLTWKPSPRVELVAAVDGGRMASPFTQSIGRYEYLSTGVRLRMPFR